MPKPCFSYLADQPTDAGNLYVVPQGPHDSKLCFSYYAGGIRNAVPSAVRGSKICFSYSAGVPLDAWNRNITPHGPHDSKLCFSY